MQVRMPLWSSKPMPMCLHKTALDYIYPALQRDKNTGFRAVFAKHPQVQGWDRGLV